MRAHFSTGWIFQGWIACMVAATFVQPTYAKPTCDDEHHYWNNNKCCKKCEPGKYLSARCSADSDTKCRPCAKNEYQTEYNTDERCIEQPFCDEGRGFIKSSSSSPTKLEPCRCKDGYQCLTSFCEFCRKIPECPPGQGLAGEPGYQLCKECSKGFFSDSHSMEPCKLWTDCKAIGKTEEKPGSTEADVACGPPFEPSTSWAMVAVPCAIVVIFAIILSCYKDKLNILSVNLQACVQNIKRSRIQQETLTSQCNSNSLQSHTQNEIRAKLIPHMDDHSESTTKTDGYKSQDEKQKTDERACSSEMVYRPSGSSSEGSEYPDSTPICRCLSKEPIEVGENEDCSELVATGLAACCSCSQAENLENHTEAKVSQDISVSLNEPASCGNFLTEGLTPHLQGSQELYLDYSSDGSKEDMSEIRNLHSDSSTYERNEPCCCSIESTAIPLSLVTTSNQGLSMIPSNDNNLPEPETALEIQNQTSEAAVTCAQVAGNKNNTFISTGQVMNFTGDVIMVYVSQTSLGSSGGEEEPYASPVQEESAECGLENMAKRAVEHGRQLPVQEMMNQLTQLNITV